MELPHLTLYLRRLRTALPGQTWRSQLRTARVQLLFQLLGWGLAALAVHLFYSPLQSALQLDRLALYYGALSFTGFWAYLAAAQQLNQLCAPLADTEQAGALPEWFGSPLSSSRVLLGVLAGSLLQLLPGMLGLVLIVLSAGQATGSALEPATLGKLATLVWQQFSMLPHFLLCAACLSLALRNAQSRNIWQPVLAATAALHLPAALSMALQGNRGISEWYWYPFTPSRLALGLGSVPLAVLLLLALAALLHSSARHGPVRPTGLFAMLGGLGAILALFQYELVARYSYIPPLGLINTWSPVTRYFELLARAVCPSAPGTWLSPELALRGFGPLHWLVPTSVFFYFWWSLAALAFWWYAALRCLDAARNVQPATAGGRRRSVPRRGSRPGSRSRAAAL